VLPLKETNFALQNLWIRGLMGLGVKICHRKCHIWNRRPWFAYPLCNVYGATMITKGSLLFVKRFQAIMGQILMFWG